MVHMIVEISALWRSPYKYASTSSQTFKPHVEFPIDVNALEKTRQRSGVMRKVVVWPIG